MTYGISDRPVREAGAVTQMSEVVDVAEELIVQLREANDWDGTVLVKGTRVALQPGAKVSNMGRYLLYHHPPETEFKKKLLKLSEIRQCLLLLQLSVHDL